MKKYIRFLIIILSISAVLLAIPFFYSKATSAARAVSIKPRNNQECPTDQRVFDYSNVLTDKQERKLEKLIAKKEKQLGLDIVIVTICENVGSDPYNASKNNTIYFAEDFYEYYKFGWDGHNSSEYAGDSTGAGVIYVDNWYDLNGYAESAFLAYRGASGESVYNHAYNLYRSERILLELENDVWEYSNTNPYLSYRRMVNHLASDMTSPNILEKHLRDWILVLLPIAIAVIFVLVNLKRRIGKKTTTMATYVAGGKADMVNRQDVFISKHTTQRHIETSSGGGGGHVGGGGGGGHSGGHSGGGGRH